MQATITVHLPQQNGCQHIHFTLTYVDARLELLMYHLSDFLSVLPTQEGDVFYAILRDRLKEFNITTKQGIKTLLDNTTIEITR